jgi:hypothetical protein
MHVTVFYEGPGIIEDSLIGIGYVAFFHKYMPLMGIIMINFNKFYSIGQI